MESKKNYWLAWEVPAEEVAKMKYSGKRCEWRRGVFWFSPLEAAAIHLVGCLIGVALIFFIPWLLK